MVLLDIDYNNTQKSGFMYKRLICLFFILLIPALPSVAYARTNTVESGLNDCRKIFSYNCRSSAYFFGYSNYTLYSAKALPSYNLRCIKVDGVIRAVCHDNDNAYALYEKSKTYNIVRMNMNNGKCDYREFQKSEKILPYSFAACGGEVFFTINGREVSSVSRYRFDGGKLNSYTVPKGVEQLFVNANKVYVKANSGEIFRLSGSEKTKCAVLAKHTAFYNAGEGYIYSENQCLISLTDGSLSYPHSKFCVNTGDENRLENSGIQFAALGDQTASLNSDFHIFITSPDDAASSTEHEKQSSGNSGSTTASTAQKSQNAVKNSNAMTFYDDSTVICENPLSVSKFKSYYNQVTNVTDAYGNTVTKGKIKSGYFANIGNVSYEISVTGDVNRNGAVNSADTDLLMKYLSNKTDENAIHIKSADINRDKTIDNRDLVLIGNRY